ncbi:hypothetical protein OPV22_000532 [Ensete ventricosum]|uniref:Secreted protein n=1 Tax=Ensete ventricosum TaxID=4639 RepID=A0AAV8RTC5_ENSVE|nr:hypothetical protein OPV22_000532 [Ensete ventricosum]
MESPAWGPLWQRACAVAFVFGGWAESQGSHPSFGRLEKHSGVLQPPFPLTSCGEWNSKLPTSNLYFFSTSGVGGGGTRERCPRRRTVAERGPSLCSSPFLYNISAPLSPTLSLFRNRCFDMRARGRAQRRGATGPKEANWNPRFVHCVPINASFGRAISSTQEDLISCVKPLYLCSGQQSVVLGSWG